MSSSGQEKTFRVRRANRQNGRLADSRGKKQKRRGKKERKKESKKAKEKRKLADGSSDGDGGGGGDGDGGGESNLKEDRASASRTPCSAYSLIPLHSTVENQYRETRKQKQQQQQQGVDSNLCAASNPVPPFLSPHYSSS
ncbi:hypothetical protein M0804_006911 [Polistes exclamans]|nr:hypothetical protein M0804_006911 [Polistes exclamans]